MENLETFENFSSDKTTKFIKHLSDKEYRKAASTYINSAFSGYDCSGMEEYIKTLNSTDKELLDTQIRAVTGTFG